MQDIEYIGEIRVPVIKKDGVTYYPVNYIMKNVLLKKTSSVSLQKEYSNYMQQFNIDYGSDSGGVQDVNCISKEGLKAVLLNSKIGGLSVDQKKSMNVLLEYLHMDVISEDDRFIKKVSCEIIDGYNEYIRDCIGCILEEDPDIVWQKCIKCGNYYPYHLNFFGENLHSGKDYPLYTICRDCGWTKGRSKDFIKHPDNELRVVYRKYGEDIYKLYKNHKTIDIYNHWVSMGNKVMPNVINNEDDKLLIIRNCYNNGMFDDYEEITEKTIYNICKFRMTGSIRKIHKEIFGVELVENIEDARKIIEDYLNKNNKEIIDKYNFPFYKILSKCNLIGFLKKYYDNDLLEFIMDYFKQQHGAYKFKGGYKKYWQKKENRIKALKYFIEKDMQIVLKKVPLYITLSALRNHSGTVLYNVCKKYYSSLFEWINEVYPHAFIEKDFDIHYRRNDFDSIEEAEIHDVMKNYFRNVIYNPRNTDYTIEIEGMIPDWFIFTDTRCYIVEYFGIAIDRKVSNNRISDYQDKTKTKVNKYNNMKYYGKVYLYPDDLKDNFKGVRDKLKNVI